MNNLMLCFVAVLIAAIPKVPAAPRADSETVAGFLGRVSESLKTKDSQPKTDFSFPGGSLEEFLLKTDFVRRFKTSLIVSGSIQDYRIGAHQLKAATLEEALVGLANAFECTIIVEQYSFKILSHEDGLVYLQKTKEPFVLVAKGGRTGPERGK